MEFHRKEGILSRAKSIILFLFRLISRPSRLSPHHHIHQVADGLKTLIYPLEENPSFIIHKKMTSPSATSSLSSGLLTKASSLSESLARPSRFYASLDDLLGSESGVCMISDEDYIFDEVNFTHSDIDFVKRNKKCQVTKEYPPLIPFLARTANLRAHMPWIMTRLYIHGKLILTMEKVKHHEYFEADRDNGRLVMNLVSLDDEFNICCASEPNEEDDQLELLVKDMEEGPAGNFIGNTEERYAGEGVRKCFSYRGSQISDMSVDENDGSCSIQHFGSAPIGVSGWSDGNNVVMDSLWLVGMRTKRLCYTAI